MILFSLIFKGFRNMLLLNNGIQVNIFLTFYVTLFLESFKKQTIEERQSREVLIGNRGK